MKILFVVKPIALAIFFISLISCTGVRMNPEYPKSAVELVSVEQSSDEFLKLNYKVLPGTVLYSTGVDYEVLEDKVNVYIKRCKFDDNTCKPMASSADGFQDDWVLKVKIPNHKKPVFLIHSDAIEQIYPK